MPNSHIPLSDLHSQFVEWSSLDPAVINAVPMPPTGPTTLPAEPSTLAMGFIGIGILAVYAGVQRWRRPQQHTLQISNAPKAKKTDTTQRPKRGAA